jgi:hypothetical protein
MTMFTRLALFVAMLTVAVLSGCSGAEMTNHPIVYVDADFGDDLPAVIDALHVWPGVEPRIAILTHADLGQLAGPTDSSAAPNTIYLVASHGTDQEGCPWTRGPVHMAGVTHPHDGSAVSCIAVDYVRATANPGHSAMKRSAAHEFGHALGLHFVGSDGYHDEAPGHLMSIDYMGPDEPTEEDLAALRARFP